MFITCEYLNKMEEQERPQDGFDLSTFETTSFSDDNLILVDYLYDKALYRNKQCLLTLQFTDDRVTNLKVSDCDITLVLIIAGIYSI